MTDVDRRWEKVWTSITPCNIFGDFLTEYRMEVDYEGTVYAAKFIYDIQNVRGEMAQVIENTILRELVGQIDAQLTVDKEANGSQDPEASSA